jgi:hypothetical protein
VLDVYCAASKECGKLIDDKSFNPLNAKHFHIIRIMLVPRACMTSAVWLLRKTGSVENPKF